MRLGCADDGRLGYDIGETQHREATPRFGSNGPDRRVDVRTARFDETRLLFGIHYATGRQDLNTRSTPRT